MNTNIKETGNKGAMYKPLDISAKEQREFFLSSLFTEDDYIQLRAIDPLGESSPAIGAYKLSQLSSIEAFVNVFNGRWNIYVGIGARKWKYGGSKECVKSIKALWIDIDVKKDHDNDYKKVVQCIKEFEFQPTIIIKTGNGLHLYWVLQESVIVTKENISHIESILKGLVQTLGGDITASEISRIMRFCGTWNVKIKENPMLCEIVGVSENRYSLEDFYKYKAVEIYKPSYTSMPIVSTEMIEDVLRKLEHVKFYGDEAEALCPFHCDHHPSFYLNTSNGLWNCRACGAAGNLHAFKEKWFEEIELKTLEEIMIRSK
jgi:hypothetical protein